MKIFFDLDGTLIDSKQRIYKLFKHLVPVSVLTFEEYWDFKKNKISHDELLENNYSFTKKDVMLFKEKWMELIESPEWLQLDKPFEGVTFFLENLKKDNEIFLVTARQFHSGVLKQLADFGWTSIFSKVFVTEQKFEKANLIAGYTIANSNDWFIGDTGKDIETGKRLCMKTAAVLTGFLNKEILLEYKPDLLIDKVIDFNPDDGIISSK